MSCPRLWISFLLVFTALTPLLLVSSALIRAPRDATKTGKYIVLLHDSVTEKEFNTTLERALSLSQDSRPYVVIRNIGKAFVLDLNQYSVHQISEWPQVKLVEEETEAFASQDASIPWHLDQLDHGTFSNNNNNGRRSSGMIDHQFRPIATGKPIDVYIMDTGIHYQHTEFNGRAKYPGYDPYDAYHGTSRYFQHGADCNGHGTHVASLFAGQRYGVAKNATIFSVRVLNCASRAPWSVILDGLDFVMKMTSQRKRASIVNLSLGGAFQLSVNQAVERLVDTGVVVVVAAGNEKADACDKTPASSSKVITVGGAAQNGDKYSSTNIGSCVDIFGPGVFVRGAHFTCNEHSVEHPNGTTNNCSYFLSGTSMATPIVGGVVALLLEKQPLMSPNDVRDKLIQNSVKNFIKGIQLPTKNLFVNTQGSCGGYYPYRTSLTITSPGYPNGYPVGVVCEWLLPVKYNEDVGVVITDIDLENGHDYLYLCDDITTNCTSYTGHYSSHIRYRTRNRNMTIRLVTDSFKSGRGFNLTFTKYYTNTSFQVTDNEELLPPIDSSSLPLATTRTYLNIDVTSVRSIVLLLKSEKYDILSLSLTLTPPPDNNWYYAIVFHNSTQTPSVGFVELTPSQLNQTIAQQKEEGLIEYDIQARLNGLMPVYSIIFRKEPPYIESHSYWGVSMPAHITAKLSMKRNGWYMISQHFLTTPRGPLVSAVYYRDLRRVYFVPLKEKQPISDNYYGFFFSRFSHLTLQYLQQNYYPKSISTYHHRYHDDKIDARFSVVYEEKVRGHKSDSYWIRWGLNNTSVRSETLHFQDHWDIVSLTSYVYNRQLRYIMQWGRKIGY